MPNASEVARELEEHRVMLLAQLGVEYRQQGLPKSRKQALLNDIRRIERELGIEGVNYNSDDFRSEIENACQNLSVQPGFTFSQSAIDSHGLAEDTSFRLSFRRTS